MSFTEWLWDAPCSEDCTATIRVIEDGFVVSKDYCPYCGSLNIKVSKRGNKYCGNLCWTK